MKNCRKGASIHRIAKVRIPPLTPGRKRGECFMAIGMLLRPRRLALPSPARATRAVWDSWLYLRQ